MPRRARVRSESGIYHAIIRGVNRQRIFEEREDEIVFLRILARLSTECECGILAYCLMSNHVHLLVNTGNGSLSSFMKRLAGRYVYWFNAKYDRIGGLFQDRFKSEAVEDDAYLLTALRYILQNPVKAGLVNEPFDYRASSAVDYLEGGGITDTKLAFGLLPKESLIRFLQQAADDVCIDVDEASSRRLTDEDAKAVVLDVSGCSSATDFQALEPAEQRRSLWMMRSAGISLRQANRLTGLSIGVIRGHLKKENP